MFLMKKSHYSLLIIGLMLATSSAQGMYSDPTFEYPMEKTQVLPFLSSYFTNILNLPRSISHEYSREYSELSDEYHGAPLWDQLKEVTKDYFWCYHPIKYDLSGRYITRRLKDKKKNLPFKAPTHVQEQSLAAAKAMCRPYNLGDWLRFQYLKKFGFLTVYEIEHPSFASETNAFTRPSGGIFFPQKSFSQQPMTPRQRFSLRHEVGHNMNGDMTQTLLEKNHSFEKGSSTWYKHEYLAHKAATIASYKHNDLDAIAAKQGVLLERLIERVGNFSGPYETGFYDSLTTLCNQNPHDEKLLKIAARIGIKPTSGPVSTLEQRYQEYLQEEKQKHIQEEQKRIHNWWPWLKKKLIFWT